MKPTWKTVLEVASRDHFNALLADIGMENHYLNNGRMTRVEEWLWAVEELLNRIVAISLCAAFDHDFTPDGRDYPEDGGEGFSCERCGYSFMAWH